MNGALEVFAWLAALEAPDAPPERRHALTNAYSLAELAVSDGHVSNDEQSIGRFVRLLAQLEADGWITWEWRRMVGDPRREPPLARFFSSLDAQNADDVRITPAGYTAYAARTHASALPAAQQASSFAGRMNDYRDVFLSHAGEDKDTIARPLFNALTSLGYSVWFDEAELVLGDSLSEEINRGLVRSRFGRNPVRSVPREEVATARAQRDGGTRDEWRRQNGPSGPPPNRSASCCGRSADPRRPRPR